MGGTASKSARKLPKKPVTEPPPWAGNRTPAPCDAARPMDRRASEVKSKDIMKDAQDPHFLANLSKLGPVRVDHNMRNIRPQALKDTARIFESRARNEEEAISGGHIKWNQLYASSLSELLDKRKSVKTAQDLDSLATVYNVDMAKLESLARYVSSPSVNGATAKKTVDKDGQEHVTISAIWVDPHVQK